MPPKRTKKTTTRTSPPRLMHTELRARTRKQQLEQRNKELDEAIAAISVIDRRPVAAKSSSTTTATTTSDSTAISKAGVRGGKQKAKKYPEWVVLEEQEESDVEPESSLMAWRRPRAVPKSKIMFIEPEDHYTEDEQDEEEEIGEIEDTEEEQGEEEGEEIDEHQDEEELEELEELEQEQGSEDEDMTYEQEDDEDEEMADKPEETEEEEYEDEEMADQQEEEDNEGIEEEGESIVLAPRRSARRKTKRDQETSRGQKRTKKVPTSILSGYLDEEELRHLSPDPVFNLNAPEGNPAVPANATKYDVDWLIEDIRSANPVIREYDNAESVLSNPLKMEEEMEVIGAKVEQLESDLETLTEIRYKKREKTSLSLSVTIGQRLHLIEKNLQTLKEFRSEREEYWEERQLREQEEEDIERALAESLKTLKEFNAEREKNKLRPKTAHQEPVAPPPPPPQVVPRKRGRPSSKPKSQCAEQLPPTEEVTDLQGLKTPVRLILVCRVAEAKRRRLNEEKAKVVELQEEVNKIEAEVERLRRKVEGREGTPEEGVAEEGGTPPLPVIQDSDSSSSDTESEGSPLKRKRKRTRTIESPTTTRLLTQEKRSFIGPTNLASHFRRASRLNNPVEKRREVEGAEKAQDVKPAEKKERPKRAAAAAAPAPSKQPAVAIPSKRKGAPVEKSTGGVHQAKRAKVEKAATEEAAGPQKPATRGPAKASKKGASRRK
ncbi:hypothetical protein TWF281_003978 [Arthrobotrys megalospora]